ncbi:MAG: polysialyltransferase family glycosyltransferase [Agathobacter sp.]
MDRDELINFVLENQNLDFIAKIITPFHLIGVEAFLVELCKSKNRLVQGVILIEKHSVSGYSINLSDIDLDEYGHIACVYYSDDCNPNRDDIDKIYEIIKKSSKYVNKTRKLYVINTIEAWSSFSAELYRKSSYNVIQVVMDDGIGSYGNLVQWCKSLWKDTKSIRLCIRYVMLHFFSKFIDIYYGIPRIYYTMFGRKNFWNHTVVDAYKTAIEQNLQPTDTEFGPKSIIYLSQPLDDPSTLEIALDILKKLKEIGYNIYIKLHPRENTNTYFEELNATNLPQQFTIESIVYNSKIKPEWVFGWCSTALFTISGFWSINCCALCDFYRKGKYKNTMKLIERMIKGNQDKFVNLKLGYEMCKYFGINEKR